MRYDREEAQEERRLAAVREHEYRLALDFFRSCEEKVVGIPGYYGHAIGPMCLKVYVYPPNDRAEEIVSDLVNKSFEWSEEHRHEDMTDVILIIEPNQALKAQEPQD
jgi:hypothetical protein